MTPSTGARKPRARPMASISGRAHNGAQSMTMLNTAVSGMLAQNNWLSTIAQNIANSSTTGYKNAETDFDALVAQFNSTSNYPGLGVTTTQRTLAGQQGGILGTATPTDLAVQGNGFF